MSNTSRDDEQREEDREKDPLYSFTGRGYRKYFEGWTSYTIVNKKGKIKVKKMYTGPLKHAELSKKQFIPFKILICVLFALSVLVYFFASTRIIASNYSIAGAFIQIGATAGYLWLFYAMFSYLCANGDFTIYEFKEVGAMRRASVFTIVFICGSALFTLIYGLAAGTDKTGDVLSVTVFNLIAALFLFFILFSEKKIQYTDRENTASLPEGAKIYED